MFDISDRDILSIKELAKLNHQYRNRLRYGSNWRADIVYKIEQGISNPNQISKLLRVRYPTVRIVFKEFEVLKEISV